LDLKNIHRRKMSQDIVADALNQIMNAKLVGKRNVHISMNSKVLTNLLEIMKKQGHVDYGTIESENGKKAVNVKIIKLNKCSAIKPRVYVKTDEIEKYLRRFLPSRRFGTIVISTSRGLIRHEEAEQNKIGGALIAYFY
jgi:ribosomal protein S8